jgi:hypothetical protein
MKDDWSPSQMQAVQVAYSWPGYRQRLAIGVGLLLPHPLKAEDFSSRFFFQP